MILPSLKRVPSAAPSIRWQVAAFPTDIPGPDYRRRLSIPEIDKLNTIETEIFEISNLSDVLTCYDGNKEVLIEILSEKISLLKIDFDDFSSNLLSKN